MTVIQPLGSNKTMAKRDKQFFNHDGWVGTDLSVSAIPRTHNPSYSQFKETAKYSCIKRVSILYYVENKYTLQKEQMLNTSFETGKDSTYFVSPVKLVPIADQGH